MIFRRSCCKRLATREPDESRAPGEPCRPNPHRTGKYNAAVDRLAGRTFSLEAARQLLPHVKAVTVEAATRVETLTARAESLPETDPARARLSAEIEDAIRTWATDVQEMGLEPKGLWLVDFDNGEGYYCWRYPEPSIAHFHGYDEGFAGRMKIV